MTTRKLDNPEGATLTQTGMMARIPAGDLQEVACDAAGNLSVNATPIPPFNLDDGPYQPFAHPGGVGVWAFGPWVNLADPVRGGFYNNFFVWVQNLTGTNAISIVRFEYAKGLAGGGIIVSGQSEGLPVWSGFNPNQFCANTFTTWPAFYNNSPNYTQVTAFKSVRWGCRLTGAGAQNLALSWTFAIRGGF